LAALFNPRPGPRTNLVRTTHSTDGVAVSRALCVFTMPPVARSRLILPPPPVIPSGHQHCRRDLSIRPLNCVAQSAVARTVQALERELGRPLFERSRRHVELTKTGHATLDGARAALAAAEAVRDAARQTCTAKCPQASVALP
jgi:hypothetical protein